MGGNPHQTVQYCLLILGRAGQFGDQFPILGDKHFIPGCGIQIASYIRF
jgi:hypothetical protein